MKLDIHTAVQAALVIAVLLGIFAIWSGIQNLRTARGMKFFRMRRDRMVRGWRLVLFSLGMVVMSVFLRTAAEPLAYKIFPPTPTLTLTPTPSNTPTITTTPTITLTPTITNTPSETNTPTITPTPRVPLAVEAGFVSTTTPNPGAVFSPLEFAQDIDEDYNLVNPNIVFQNPVGHLYARFSYDQMTEGAQWTAIWLRNGEVVHYESQPWDGAVGGFGYTDWDAQPSDWQPGEYEVQIFVGHEWKVSGTFTVEGDAPTPFPSLTPTPSKTIRATATETQIPTATLTRTPRPPTPTPSPTITRWPTPTKTLTPTPTSTRTRQPTSTTSP